MTIEIIQIKDKPKWVVGIAWIEHTLYIGLIIYLAFKFKEVSMIKDEEIRQEIQRLWCQHCKALQKTNNTVVECWYNPLDHSMDKAFCAANVDAVEAILKALSK